MSTDDTSTGKSAQAEFPVPMEITRTTANESHRLQARLDALVEYCDDWLARSEEIRLADPMVRRFRDEARLARRALNEWPAVLGHPPIEPVAGLICDVQDLRMALPRPQSPNLSTVAISTTASGTWGTIVASHIPQRIDDTFSPEVKEFCVTIAAAHRDILRTYVQPEEVRSTLLRKLNIPAVLAAFDSATTAYQEWKACRRDRVSTAGAIRGLLEAVWGELWDKARKPYEQKMSYEIIAQRLALVVPGGKGEQVIKVNGSINDGLQKQLSNVFHRRETRYVVDLERTWGEALDHINSVLTATRL